MYTAKTTIIVLHTTRWDYSATEAGSNLLIDAIVSAAALIGRICEMDVMSLSYHPCDVNNVFDTPSATVVYVNNGATLADIMRNMAPEVDNYPPDTFWSMGNFEEFAGRLEGFVTAREEWPGLWGERPIIGKKAET